jgi:hypothetical protein
MTINEPLLRAVVDRIIADPDSLDMSNWVKDTACGTTACVAGHTVLEAGCRVWKNPSSILAETGVYSYAYGLDEKEFHPINVIAGDLLGLSHRQRNEIFYGIYFCNSRKQITDETSCVYHQTGIHRKASPREVIENIAKVTGLEFKIPEHIQ